MNNLRPVSLLPLPGKILERLFHKKVSAYLDENNGFRKGRSTIGTVAELTDVILLVINNRSLTIAAFIDLRKAFNTVSHEILGKKLHKFGFHKNIIAWLIDYHMEPRDVRPILKYYLRRATRLHIRSNVVFIVHQ